MQGLKLSDSYSPSLTEVREYIDSGGSYSKGIKIGLQDGETLGPNEAISLAQANVSFTANTPLDFTGQTSGTLTNAGTEALQVVYFQKLLEKGFLALGRIAKFDPYFAGDELTYVDFYAFFGLSPVIGVCRKTWEWDIKSELAGLKGQFDLMSQRKSVKKVKADQASKP